MRGKGGRKDEILGLAFEGQFAADLVAVVAQGLNTVCGEVGFREKGCVEPRFAVDLLVGFAGWGPGQLEAEIAAGTWLHGALTPELVFDWPREEVWLRTLAMLGVNPAFLVEDSGSAH